MKKMTLFALESVFVAALLLVAHLADFHPTFFDIAVIALAASFNGRAVAYLEIFEWLRAPFTVVVPHSAGVGETVERLPDATGWKAAIGGLVSCPVCAGTWSANVLFGLYATTEFGRYLAYVLAAACIAWTVSYLTELVEWNKHLAWERTGQANRDNKAHNVTYLSANVLNSTGYIQADAISTLDSVEQP